MNELIKATIHLRNAGINGITGSYYNKYLLEIDNILHFYATPGLCREFATKSQRYLWEIAELTRYRVRLTIPYRHSIGILSSREPIDPPDGEPVELIDTYYPTDLDLRYTSRILHAKEDWVAGRSSDHAYRWQYREIRQIIGDTEPGASFMHALNPDLEPLDDAKLMLSDRWSLTNAHSPRLFQQTDHISAMNEQEHIRRSINFFRWQAIMLAELIFKWYNLMNDFARLLVKKEAKDRLFLNGPGKRFIEDTEDLLFED